jgi:hypothetical protein
VTYPEATPPSGTHFGVHETAGDETTADIMLKEARIHLAFLQRFFSIPMSHTPEGRCYLIAIEEECRKAHEWATAHCQPMP